MLFAALVGCEVDRLACSLPTTWLDNEQFTIQVIRRKKNHTQQTMYMTDGGLAKMCSYSDMVQIE